MGFDPITMGAMAAGSAIVGAVSNIEAGQAASNASNYNAALAGYNSQQAMRNAAMVSESGAAKAGMVGRETRANLGSAKARAAGGGLQSNSGSPVDVQQSVAELGHLDALTVRTNAAKEAYGYQVQSTNFQNQGEMDKFEGKQAKTASYYKAASSLLGAGSDAASNYQKFKMAGVGNSGALNSGSLHPNTDYGMDEL